MIFKFNQFLNESSDIEKYQLFDILERFSDEFPMNVYVIGNDDMKIDMKEDYDPESFEFSYSDEFLFKIRVEFSPRPEITGLTEMLNFYNNEIYPLMKDIGIMPITIDFITDVKYNYTGFTMSFKKAD